MRFSVIASGLVAALVGFGSTLAVIVAAAQRLGGTPDQISSWVAALCLGMAATSGVLSVRYRMPMITAWSLAGAVLIASVPAGTSMGDGVGAFILAGALTVLAGAVPALGRLIALLPTSVAAGMLAGLLLRFVLGLFAATQDAAGLVVPLFALFLVARQLHPASASLVVIVLGPVVAALEGYTLTAPHLALSTLSWMAPSWSPVTLVGLGIPLFLVSMATQQISGAAVLRTSGYEPPFGAALVVTGAATVLLAPFGGFSLNLSSITASICTGPDAHPDPAKRWLTGPVFAVTYVVVAAVGASLAGALAALPPVLVATVVGVALLGPLTGALASAAHREHERFAATIAFAVTGSGMTLGGVGGAFWGLLAGVLALGIERQFRRWRK